MEEDSSNGQNTPETPRNSFKPSRLVFTEKARSFEGLPSSEGNNIQEGFIHGNSADELSRPSFERLKTHRTELPSRPLSPLKRETHRTPPISPSQRRLPATSSSQFHYNYFNQQNSRFRRLRRPSSSFIELSNKIENGYRKFMPVNASNDPHFQSFGDTVQETHKIFELIFLNLEFFGQSFTDIAHLQIYLTKQDALEQVEEAINIHLRGHYPPINVVYSDALPNQCTIQVIATCFYNPPPTYQYPQKRVTQQLSEHDSFNSMRKPTPLNHYSNTQILRDRQERSSPIAELLPLRLAIAFGYIGNPAQRLKACMLFVTGMRGFVSLIVIVNLSLLFSASQFNIETERLEGLNSSFNYLLSVGVMCTVTSLTLFAYGVVWLYYNAKCLDEAYVFNSSVPTWLTRFFKRFCQLGTCLDRTQILMLLSSSSAVFAITTILTSVEDEQLKQRLRLSATFGIIAFILLVVLTKFSTLLYRTFRRISYNIPVKNREKKEVENKQKELVKFLTGKQTQEHNSNSLARN